MLKLIIFIALLINLIYPETHTIKGLEILLDLIKKNQAKDLTFEKNDVFLQVSTYKHE